MRLADRYSRTTGWVRYQDCRDPLTDGRGNDLSWWALLLVTVFAPWFVLSAIAFEALALRLDR